MNTPDQVPKPNSGSIPSPDAMVVEMSDKEKTQHAECMKHCFRKVCYLSLVVIISFTVSVLTTKYISSLMALQPSQKSSSEQVSLCKFLKFRTPISCSEQVSLCKFLKFRTLISCSEQVSLCKFLKFRTLISCSEQVSLCKFLKFRTR